MLPDNPEAESADTVCFEHERSAAPKTFEGGKNVHTYKHVMDNKVRMLPV